MRTLSMMMRQTNDRALSRESHYQIATKENRKEGNWEKFEAGKNSTKSYLEA